MPFVGGVKAGVEIQRRACARARVCKRGCVGARMCVCARARADRILKPGASFTGSPVLDLCDFDGRGVRVKSALEEEEEHRLPRDIS